MRTTLQIDDDVYDDARAIAQQERRSPGAVISELARRSLKPAGITSDCGFPVFEVPSDAPSITLDDVRRAGEEE